MITYFEQPCLCGWVYPCTLEDLSNATESLPAEDIDGLRAIGLATATRKDCSANARYIVDRGPAIHIYAFPSNMIFRQPAGTKRPLLDLQCLVELRYGMKIIQDGNRFDCVWRPEDLREFVLRHVLMHEIGHHVYYKSRIQSSLRRTPGTTASEQFAEAYALRNGSIKV